ncbi:MAG: hypothetical protein WAO76_13565 [Georgfuchsia sp.]
MQPDEFSLLNIERFSNAMVDLESIDSLNQSGQFDSGKTSVDKA